MTGAVATSPLGAAVSAVRRQALWWVVVVCVGCLGGALYLQHVHDWQPCPLCVLQRIAFVAVLLFALLALLTRHRPGVQLTCRILAVVSALSGVAVAGRHLYVKAHPAVSCGIDPLETAINAQWWVQKMPWLLKADGLCFLPLPPLLGLQLPVWSLLALLLLTALTAVYRPSGRQADQISRG